MALNLKNAAVERLATEVARRTGETKTEAIRKALLERRQRLVDARLGGERRSAVLAFLEQRVWAKVPKRELGRRLTRQEEDDILGYGPNGV
jgi:antitoxin VapB